MFNLTVLGKYGPYPKAGGACSSYLIRTNSSNILIDLGTGSLSNLQKMLELNDIDLIILSHLHSDHISDVLTLRYAIQVLKLKPIKLYMPKSPEAEVDIISSGDRFIIDTIQDEQSFAFNDLQISFKKMKHPVETYAIKIKHEGKSFVFSGDTVFNSDIIKLSKNCDLLLFDSAILEADRTVSFPHASAYQAGYTAKMAEVKKLLMTHINPEMDEEKLLAEAKDEFSNSIVVKELAVYEI
jgi:ribonuclease BN (tRNA processing enzyme)